MLLVALAAFTMASCAKTEVVQINQGNEISFSAWTANPSRVAPTTTATITDFNVWAFTPEFDAYFSNQLVEWDDAKWDYTPHKFWSDVALDFYAVSPASQSANIVAEDTNSDTVLDAVTATVDFTANTAVASQVDLLYAVNLGATRTNPTVNLAFDHALSLVSFKAKNANTGGLKVTVTGVEVANVNSNGVFTLPIASATVGDDDEATAELSNWSAQGVPANYAATMEVASVELTDALVELTEDAEGRLLLVPQTTTAWDPVANPKTNTGSYILVECTVQDPATNLYLWGDAGAPKQMAVPFAANWAPGKHYIYNIVFGEGAGYVPPTDDTEGGEDVLIPITFDVVVDDFTPAPVSEDKVLS